MKKYFFRDLSHKDNLKDGKTYHCSGIVDKVYNRKETNSGKDILVTYLNPFSCEVESTWRTYSEVELFEVDEWEWEDANNRYKQLQNIT